MALSSKKRSIMPDLNELPNLSLVIPVHNEKDGILRKLNNSVNLDYPKDKLEIIIVDDGSTDETCSIIEEFLRANSRSQKILLLKQSWSGKASALNYAWTRCVGDIVAITDADVILEADALQCIVKNFSNPKVGAVTGRLCVSPSSVSSSSVSEKNYRSIFDLLRQGESYIDSTPIFNGLIMAFRRQLLGKLDSGVIADDTELAMHVRESGWRAIYDPKVISYEFVAESQQVRSKQKIRRGRGIVQSFIRHRKMFLNRKYGKYGLLIFPSEFFMHIISPILLVIMVLSLVPLMIMSSFMVPIDMFVSIILAGGVFLGVLLFFELLRHRFATSKKLAVNPLSIFASFLTHEWYLIVVLFSYFLRTSHIRRKKEDIRSAWQTKTA
jgi:cellulose synthase/poly-beta-1,6-N-acetylglucosamine synthase-like glycosyltransferase